VAFILKINRKSLLYGTLVLTIANFIVRLLGFVYRIVLSRLMGPQGMGLMQLVFPVFQIAITLTTAGLPTAISRLVSAKNARGDIRGIRHVVKTTLLLVTGVSIVITIAALCNLDGIAKNIIGDERARSALFVLFPCITVIGLGSSLKGFFYGIKEIHPPALAEIIEQLTRMALALSLLFLFASEANDSTKVAVTMLGTVFGELASLLFLHYRYYRTSKALYSARQPIPAKHEKILGTILAIALPITATRLINSLMNAVNSIMIPQRLTAGGMLREEAVGMYGILSGMVLPILFLPSAITNALTVVIIPDLSENLALKNWDEIRNKVSRAMLITCLTAFPCTALMASLGRPIGEILYHQPMAGTLLVPISYAIVFHAISHTCSGILNGLGKQTQGAVHFLIGNMIQILCSYFLLANPSIRVYGLLIGVFLNNDIVCICNLVAVLKTTRMPFRFPDWILKPGFSALLMALACSALHNNLGRLHIPVLTDLILSVVAGFITFFLSLWAVRGLPPELLKFGKKTAAE
jgi:stage V sporulation protein B